MISGTIFNKNGSPAKNVSIYLRKKTYLANISAFLSKKSTVLDRALATTDGNGKFTIDTVDTGVYVLEGTDGGNNLALNDSVSVKNKGSTVVLPPDTLEPAGAIKGVIRLSNGGDPRKVFVLAFGIDKFAQVDSGGGFKFMNLAPGKYDLRLIPVLDNYNVLDEFNIPVKAADTTNLDTIKLPYTGIPSLTGLKVSYDSLNQIVKLLWNKPTTGKKVQSYTIYRKNSDSINYVAIKGGLTDTTYNDSTVLPDQTYAYGVAVIDTNNSRGDMSIAGSVMIATYFHVDTSFGGVGTGPGQFDGPISSMAIDQNGNFIILGGYIRRIQVFSSTMEYKFEIDTPNVVSPNFIDVDVSGNIHCLNAQNMINVFNPNGTFKDSFTVVPTTIIGTNPEYAGDICIHNNELFFIVSNNYDTTFNDSVKVTDLHGIFKRSWAVPNAMSLNINSSNEVFVTDYNSIQIYDTQGNFKSSIPNVPFAGKVAFDSKGRIIVNHVVYQTNPQTNPPIIVKNELLFFDTNGNYFARYKLLNETSSCIYSANVAGRDFIYVALNMSYKILKISNMLP
jgi:hypothetical protein